MILCEIGLFHIVWSVSKGTHDNYHEIWWKCFRSKIYQYIWISKYINIYVQIPPYIFHRTFFVYYSKKRIKYKSMTYTKIKHIILIHFFFLGWIIKKLPEGAQGAPILFLYKLSIVVLIDFIAILLTPGIFLI